MDVDGDGLSDLVNLFQSVKSKKVKNFAESWISQGDGSFQDDRQEKSVVSFGEYDVDEKSHFQQRYMPMDVDGDGLSDLVHIYQCRTKKQKTCASISISQGDGTFQRLIRNPYVGNWSDVDASDARSYLPMDVNADGLSDLVEIAKCSRDGKDKTCAASWISKGNRFSRYIKDEQEASTVGAWSDVNASDARRYLPMDVNADGLSDLVEIAKCSRDGKDKTCAASWISKGDGRFSRYIDDEQEASTVGVWSDVDAPNARRYLTIDVNGDSLPDLVEIAKCFRDGKDKTCAASYISKGDGSFIRYISDEQIASDVGGWSNVNADDARRYLPMDVNGDGLSDLVELYKGKLRVRSFGKST
ncbi:MAG: hypothetical protein QNJ54_23265 [Prochloraceae cyanobacterium]|nr:hypothetical protein [Prochloraceae cyanobacterium]